MKKTWRVLIVCVLALAGVAALSAGAYRVMSARGFQFFGEIVTSVKTNEKTVYLTFDDGPSEHTPEILRTLDQLDVKATFFLVGKAMEDQPEFAKAIIDAGHDVGNHSYTHARLVFMPLALIKYEVNKTNEIIKSLGYEKEIFFRAPGCKKLFLLPWYLGSIGQTSVTWTLEPETQGYEDAHLIAQYVTDNISQGAIILLHPMYGDTDSTLEAIRLIVSDLKNKGYSFETLSEGLSTE